MSHLKNVMQALALVAVTLVPVNECRANIFGDVWGIVTDPLKLRESSTTLADSLDRTMAQLHALESQTNGHVAERLDQIRKIIAEAMVGTQQLLDKATGDMLRLEARVNSDAVELIYRSQCAAKETIDQGRRAFADAVSDLGQSNPALYIFGVKISDIRTKNISIELPNEAYWNTKQKMLDHLRQTTKDTTSAVRIFDVYSNLQSMAKMTLCHYIDQPAATKVWTQEMNQMEVLAEPWTDAVIVTR